MHPANPELFILIPCYNDPKGLQEALESIQYDPENYRVVVVDDGSTVPVSESLRQWGLSSVHCIRLARNSGITKALNTGLEYILRQPSCRLIARLDCRDICDSRRFNLQTEFMNRHPEVGILGSWCIFRDETSGLSYTYKTPTEHKDIQKEMPRRNVFIHPTVMFRRDILKICGLYPERYPYVEDYALFWKMLTTCKGAVLPEYLVTCAVRKEGISLSNRRKQLIGRKKVINQFSKRNFGRLIGLIKINILMILPKPLLLRVKSLINN